MVRALHFGALSTLPTPAAARRSTRLRPTLTTAAAGDGALTRYSAPADDVRARCCSSAARRVRRYRAATLDGDAAIARLGDKRLGPAVPPATWACRRVLPAAARAALAARASALARRATARGSRRARPTRPCVAAAPPVPDGASECPLLALSSSARHRARHQGPRDAALCSARSRPAGRRRRHARRAAGERLRRRGGAVGGAAGGARALLGGGARARPRLALRRRLQRDGNAAQRSAIRDTVAVGGARRRRRRGAVVLVLAPRRARRGGRAGGGRWRTETSSVSRRWRAAWRHVDQDVRILVVRGGAAASDACRQDGRRRCAHVPTLPTSRAGGATAAVAMAVGVGGLNARRPVRPGVDRHDRQGARPAARRHALRRADATSRAAAPTTPSPPLSSAPPARPTAATDEDVLLGVMPRRARRRRGYVRRPLPDNSSSSTLLRRAPSCTRCRIPARRSTTGLLPRLVRYRR